MAVLGIIPIITGCGESKAEKEARLAKERQYSIRISQEKEEKRRKIEEERVLKEKQERLEQERLEAERIEQERLEAEAEKEKLAKQGPDWLQGDWKLDITSANGIHISTYNLSINGSNSILIEGGNLKYDGEFIIDGNRMKVGPRTYILNDYSKTLEYSGMYSFRKVGDPLSNGSNSSSFKSPNDVLSYLSGKTFYNDGDALRISYDAIYLNGSALTGAPRVESVNGATATIVANSPYGGGSAIHLYVDGSNNTVTQNGDVYMAR